MPFDGIFDYPLDALEDFTIIEKVCQRADIVGTISGERLHVITHYYGQNDESDYNNTVCALKEIAHKYPGVDMYRKYN